MDDAKPEDVVPSVVKFSPFPKPTYISDELAELIEKTNNSSLARPDRKPEKLTDYGPQKQPSSLPKIMAETKQVKTELGDEVKTVVVIAGNSDNKLSQQEWHHFCKELHNIVATRAYSIEFHAGSNSLEYYQNACWVFTMNDERLDLFKHHISEIRAAYIQNSLAVIVGDTEFI